MAVETERIAEQVHSVIQEVLKVDADRIKPESRIREDLGADSLDRVTLLMALEEAFEDDISDEEAEKLVTVADVIAFIKAKADTAAKST
jgi:acyl carrier protein